MTIFYTLGENLYVNITNRCSCSCVFCLRESGDGVGDAQSLWLPREPLSDEIKAAFDVCLNNPDFKYKKEIVFCGYGEPMERADTVTAVCEYIKSKCALPVRLNTNGLVKLLKPDFDLSKLAVFNSVSVSLNAADEEEYLKVTRSRFGMPSYEAMLNFAREAKKYTDVIFTVVDIIGEENIKKCANIARNLDIPLRIRTFMQK